MYNEHNTREIQMIKELMIMGAVFLLLSIAACFVIKKVEEAAVLKNELQEANEDEIRSDKELEIANRPDVSANNLLKRMRNGT